MQGKGKKNPLLMCTGGDFILSSSLHKRVSGAAKVVVGFGICKGNEGKFVF